MPLQQLHRVAEGLLQRADESYPTIVPQDIHTPLPVSYATPCMHSACRTTQWTLPMQGRSENRTRPAST
jgi:hypothetical protein